MIFEYVSVVNKIMRREYKESAMEMKLCVIYNSAQHYREPIFTLIDKTFDTEWHFGTFRTDSIKQMDLSHLKCAKRHPTSYFGRYYWMKGYIKLLFNKSYGTYLALGETHNLSTWAFLVLSKLFPKKKVFFWTHGFYGKETKFECFVKKIMFGLADGIFPYGEYSKNLMIKHGIPSDKIWPIHNSLDYDAQVSLRNSLQKSDIYERHFGNNNPVLIFIGRLTPVKRLDTILDAMKILRERGEQYNLVLIGDGPEKDKILQKADQAGLMNFLWLYGACYNEAENAELIFNADLCVAPGNIGLTAMHVLAFGTPAATHNNFAWQMPEFEAIKEGETGFFFNYLDVQSMADGISKWFSAANDRDQIRKACVSEMDKNWNRNFQIKVLQEHLIV